MSIFRDLYSQADQTGRLIESFVQKVKGQGRIGLQYKHIKELNIVDEIARENGLIRMPDGSYRNKKDR